MNSISPASIMQKISRNSPRSSVPSCPHSYLFLDYVSDISPFLSFLLLTQRRVFLSCVSFLSSEFNNSVTTTMHARSSILNFRMNEHVGRWMLDETAQMRILNFSTFEIIRTNIQYCHWHTV